MTAITFDTLKFANRLKAGGVSSTQAEAEAEALSDVFEANMSELATKADLRALETNLRHEITDLRKDMHVLGQSMVIKLGSLVVVAVGALAAVLKLL